MFNAAASWAAEETWLRRGRFAVLAALVDLALYNLYQIIYSPTKWSDFAYFYSFAKAGLTYGDRRLYDPMVQLTSLHALFPSAEFYAVVNPPPFAWLLALITIMPYSLALWMWTLSMVAALAISSQLLAPNQGYPRTLFMSSWLGFLPAYLVFVSAPLAPLVMLSVALTWRFIRAERPVAAGLVLAIGLTKPTLMILLVPIWLVLGSRNSASSRTFVGGAWIAAWLGLIFPVWAIVAAAAIPVFLLARNLWSPSTSVFKSSEQAAFVPSLTPRPGDKLVTAQTS